MRRLEFLGEGLKGMSIECSLSVKDEPPCKHDLMGNNSVWRNL